MLSKTTENSLIVTDRSNDSPHFRLSSCVTKCYMPDDRFAGYAAMMFAGLELKLVEWSASCESQSAAETFRRCIEFVGEQFQTQRLFVWGLIL